MKLKPVVASLVVLGLMTPAFAKSTLLSQQAVIDQNSVIAPLCTEGWFNRIRVGAAGSIAGIVGNHGPAGAFTTSNNSSDLYINDFKLLLEGTLSSWSKVNFNLAYLGAPIQWNKMDPGKDNRYIRHSIVADEAYVTIADLAKYPFYFIAGKKYLPFGDYQDPHTPWQIMSPAQMLAQTNAVTAIAGVSSDFGLYASLFGYRGETSPKGSENGNIRGFGGKIGYYDNLESFNVPNAHVNFALSYIHNLWDSMVFSPNTEPQWGWIESSSSGFKNYHPAGSSSSKIDPVGGVSVHGDLAYKAFSMSANFVTAVKKMVDETYSPKQYNNSRFWGADVNADYSFKTLDRNSSLGASAQFSGNGAWFGDNSSSYGNTDWARMIPTWRFLAEYKVNLFKNTDLSLIVSHGKSYDFVNSVPAGDSGHKTRNTTLGLARLMVKI